MASSKQLKLKIKQKKSKISKLEKSLTAEKKIFAGLEKQLNKAVIEEAKLAKAKAAAAQKNNKAKKPIKKKKPV